MSIFRKALPGLYDGVSQQSATIRSAMQCSAQVNAWATIADGLAKRPPSEHVATVDPNGFGSATIHHINRDSAERYIVVITDGDVLVFDHQTGAAKTVNFPYGKAYLDCTDPRVDFGVVTVADYTFVVNRTKPVQMEAVGATTDYSQMRWLNRSYAYSSAAAGSVSQYPYNTTPSMSYKGEKQRFEDLPDTATNGDAYKITGTDETGFTSYYVVRMGGVWEETRKHDLTQNKLDPLTMPHVLVREANGSFTFAPVSWAERKVGDTNSNPNPTFVGRTINDVFFVQNRLAFLVDENVVTSCAADFGNFWRNTVTSYVASDPIDVAVTGSSVSVLHHAVPFADSVMLFGDQQQFVLSWGQDGMTPDSVALTPVTSYKVNVAVKPVMNGRDVYFCANSASYSRVYEYYNRPTDGGVGMEAADITAHIPRYIPSGITKMAADVTNDALFVITPSRPNRVYVYKFAWADGSEKAQSCWGYWQFDQDAVILSVECLDSNVYLLIERPDGVSLERVNLQSGVSAPGVDHQVYLDRRVIINGTYQSGSNRTVFNLPYGFDTSRLRIVRGSGSGANVKEALLDPGQYSFPAAGQVAIPGNVTGPAYLAGLAYEFRYTFSPQFASTDSGAILTGRTILRSMTVYFTDTAFFSTEVAPYGVDPTIESVVPAKVSDFTAKTLGSNALVLGAPVYATGDYSFQVYGEGDVAVVSLVNDTHVAATFQSAEVELTYHNRAR